ncbi:MAG: TonB-dependent receptor [candidate division WOR-3 bacterium]
MKRMGKENFLSPRRIIIVALLVFSFFFYSPNVEAGITGKIAGTVVDAQTGEPLIGANVIIEGTAMGAATDENGFFFILNVPPDIYNVQARLIGYESMTLRGVEVVSDLTTRLKFELKRTVVPGEGVTVKAKIDLIKLDLASSAISAKRENIEAVPFVNDIGDYINKQAGVRDLLVRGGTLDQVSFTRDGLNLVDGRTNSPALRPPLSMVKEVSVVKGGFAPEYGNLRAGLINIVTREPSVSYEGTATFRYSPPHMKHLGPSLFDTTNYWVGAYVLTEAPAMRIMVKGKDTVVDYVDSLCWLGKRGLLKKSNNALKAGDTVASEYYKALMEKYKEFTNGWLVLAKNNPDSARKLRESFIWSHRLQGAEELVPPDYDGPPRVGKYGDKPDWSVDAGFGGPVPVVGKFLGDLSFYGAYRLNKEAFPLPSSREYFTEHNGCLKLVSRLTKSMKVSLDLMYGERNSLSHNSNGEFGGEGTPPYLDLSRGTLGDQVIEFVQGRGYKEGPAGNRPSGVGGIYLTSADDAFRSLLVTNMAAYYPAFIPPYNVYYDMQGISFDHVLSEKTFYSLRITRLGNRRECSAYESFEPRDTVTKYTLPSGIKVTEIPYGYFIGSTLVQPDGIDMGASCAGAVDSSHSVTWTFKADLTTQINSNNEIKVGFEYEYDDMHTYYEKNRWEADHENWVTKWDASPIRGGAYIQDKIEFEGFIATVGVRADWNDPNCEWFSNLRNYEPLFTSDYKKGLMDKTVSAEMHPAKGHFYLSPRVSVSHPIAENVKLYFSYGDFYSLPSSQDMYQISWGPDRLSVLYVGDPELEWPLTRAYELGTDWGIGNLFMIHLAGYYKDIRNQLEGVWYLGEGRTNPAYRVPENLNFEDIRGIDFRISREFGDWVRGWLNYDYRVRSYGRVGRKAHYYEPVDNAQLGAWDTLEVITRPQPILNANIQFLTPKNLGVILGGISLSFSYTWEAGAWETFDPLHEAWDPKCKILNLQWKPYQNVQARLTKDLSFAGVNLSLFGEVDNLFNWKYLDAGSGCFVNMKDRDDYFKSLKLPLYGEEGYEVFGEKGNDRPGDFSSDEKPYINDPNLPHLAFHNPRYFVFGVRVDF